MSTQMQVTLTHFKEWENVIDKERSNTIPSSTASFILNFESLGTVI